MQLEYQRHAHCSTKSLIGPASLIDDSQPSIKDVASLSPRPFHGSSRTSKRASFLRMTACRTPSFSPTAANSLIATGKMIASCASRATIRPNLFCQIQRRVIASVASHLSGVGQRGGGHGTTMTMSCVVGNQYVTTRNVRGSSGPTPRNVDGRHRRSTVCYFETNPTLGPTGGRSPSLPAMGFPLSLRSIWSRTSGSIPLPRTRHSSDTHARGSQGSPSFRYRIPLKSSAMKRSSRRSSCEFMAVDISAAPLDEREGPPDAWLADFFGAFGVRPAQRLGQDQFRVSSWG